MLSQAEINQFYDQGYVITGPMDLDLLERLRKASYIEVEKIGAAMPDRMPGSYNPQIQPGPFAEYLASPHVLDVIEDLLGTDIYGLSLHCRVGNFKEDQKMVWHRDGMAPHHTAEKEMEILMGRRKTVQWNCSLYDGDTCFRFVPASHCRPISAQELACFKEDPRGDLPGQKVAELGAGETSFYNNSILHQGVYKQGQRRETFFGGVRIRTLPLGVAYAREKEYMLEPGYLESLPARLRPVLEPSLDIIRDVMAGRLRTCAGGLGSVAYMEMLQCLDESGR